MSPKETSRKDFLKILAAGAATVATFFGKAIAKKIGKGLPPPKGEHRWGMAIDLNRCTACQSCVVACSTENNLMWNGPNEAALGRVIRWIRILPETRVSESSVSQRLIPVPCQQCDDPPCVHVCPVSATYETPEGIVGQVYSRCIGCRYCVNACPYTAKYFNWFDPQWPKDVKIGFNPDVSLRYKGVVEKCLFCDQRLQRAKDKARKEGRRDIREGEYVPACKAACPAQAIAFGDLNDPKSEVSRLSGSRGSFTLLEELGTEPKVTYLEED